MSNPFLTKLLNQQAASGSAASSARRALQAGKKAKTDPSNSNDRQAFAKLLDTREKAVSREIASREDADRATASAMQARDDKAVLTNRKLHKEHSNDLIAKQLATRTSAAKQLTAKRLASETAEKKSQNSRDEARRASAQLGRTEETTHRPVEVGSQTVAEASIFAILSGDLQGITPETLVDKLSKNQFFNDALAADDVSSFLDQPVTVKSLLTSVGVSTDVQEQIVSGGVSLEAKMTPRQLMASLGADSERIATELLVIKESLPIDGLQPWLDRAAAINRMNSANFGTDKINLQHSQDSQFGNGIESLSGTFESSYLDRTGIREPLSPVDANQQIQTSFSEASTSPNLAGAKTIAGQAGRSTPVDQVTAVQSQEETLRDLAFRAGQGSHGQQTNGPGEVSNSGRSASQPTANAATHDAYRHMAHRFDRSPGSDVHRSFGALGTAQHAGQQAVAAGGSGGSTLEALLGRQLDTSVGKVMTEGSRQVLVGQPNGSSDAIEDGESQWSLGPNTSGTQGSPGGAAINQKLATGAQPNELNFVGDGDTSAVGKNLSLVKGGAEADATFGKERHDGSSGNDGSQGGSQDSEHSGRQTINQTLLQLGDEKQLAKASAFEGLTGVSNQNQMSSEPTTAARVALVERLTEQATYLSRQGGGTVKLDLSSAELGAMEVAVQVEGDRIDLRMLTTSNSVKDLMAAELTKLREALSVQGLQLGQVEVGLEGREETVSRQDTLSGFNHQGFNQQGHDEGGQTPRSPLHEFLRDTASHLAKPPIAIPTWNVPAINTTGQLAIRA